MKEKRCKIANVTKELLYRDHKGNAFQDALDLKDCFEKLKEKVKEN